MIHVDPDQLDKLQAQEIFWACVRSVDGTLLSDVKEITKPGKVELPITTDGEWNGRGYVFLDRSLTVEIGRTALMGLRKDDTVWINWN